MKELKFEELSLRQKLGMTYIAFTNIDVVIFDWNYVIIDLIIAMVIIVISALFPMFYIRKVKPVNILKAKE